MEDARLTQKNPHLVRLYTLYQASAWFLAILAGLAIASYFLLRADFFTVLPDAVRHAIRMLGYSKITGVALTALAVWCSLAATLMNRGAVHRSRRSIHAALVGTVAISVLVFLRVLIFHDVALLALGRAPFTDSWVEDFVVILLGLFFGFGHIFVALLYLGYALALFINLKGEPPTGRPIAPGMVIKPAAASDMAALEALYVGSMVADGSATDALQASKDWKALNLSSRPKRVRVLFGQGTPLGFYSVDTKAKTLTFFLVAAGHRRRGHGAHLYRDFFIMRADRRLAGWKYEPRNFADRNFFRAKGWVADPANEDMLLA